MSSVRRILLGFTAVALLWGCDAEAPKPAPDNGAKPCKGVLDCAVGQGCVQNVCVDLPCGGRCGVDELCIDNACFAMDGLSCVQDPSVCAAGFRCSQASGECQRECVTDLDCTAEGFGSCNVQEGVCGECTFNSDCKDANAPTCDTSVSRCVGCVANEDCRVAGQAQGLQCDPVTQTCESGCNRDDDCASGLRCSGATENAPGRCIECSPETELSDCPLASRMRCEPTSQLCVECLRNDDCESGQCDTRSNRCVQCVQNEYCAKGYTCDLDTFQCFVGCAGKSGGDNCPSAFPACDKTRGERGTCVECLQDAHCALGQVCKRGSGDTLPKCVDGCRLNATGNANNERCPPADHPERTLCDDRMGPSGQCVECLTDRDCPATKTCDSALKVCRCKGLGETCGATSECGWRSERGICDLGSSHGAMCMTKCGDHSVAPICTFSATALIGEQGNCPAGYVAQYATDAQGNRAKKCVPTSYQCN